MKAILHLKLSKMFLGPTSSLELKKYWIKHPVMDNTYLCKSQMSVSTSLTKNAN